MILLLVGATTRAIGAVREVARSHAIEVRLDLSPDPPDWVMTATPQGRAEAIRRFGLPSHRVIEFRDLADDREPPRDALRSALARMSEIGQLPRSRSRLETAVATCALPLLTEWATWHAADEARQKLAAHAEFLRTKHGPALKGRMLFVAPDGAAFAVLRGLLSHVSSEGHEAHVAITHPPAGDPDLSLLQGAYRGLTVGRAPDLDVSPWRPLANALRRNRPARAIASRAIASVERALPLELNLISFLEDQKPDVLIVVPHASVESPEVDYLRAARWLGVRSLYLPLRWDDLTSSSGLRYGAPDVVAAWNQEQGRTVSNDYRCPEDRIHVTGALLPSDIVDRTAHEGRDTYCAGMGIDPSQRIILFEAPASSTRASMARFEEWRRMVKASAEPGVGDAAVVVYVDNPEDVAVWRRLAAAAEVAVARSGTDERRAPFRLNESLMAADVVVATGVTMTLEATARGKPVIALLDAGNPDLAGFCRVYSPTYTWPVVVQSNQDLVAQISLVLGSAAVNHDPRRAAALVRVDPGETGARRVCRLLDELARRERSNSSPTPPPAWKRALVLWCAALARRRSSLNRPA